MRPHSRKGRNCTGNLTYCEVTINKLWGVWKKFRKNIQISLIKILFSADGFTDEEFQLLASFSLKCKCYSKKYEIR